jgi:hypothetical protein
MDHEAFKLHHLEGMLFDETAQPANLPLSLLEAITKNFSDDQEIGRGGYAVVYKVRLTPQLPCLDYSLSIYSCSF